MKVSIIFGVGTVLQVVSGLAVYPRQISDRGFIHAPMWRRDQTRSVENDLVRRSHILKRATTDVVNLSLDNTPTKTLYYANSTLPGMALAND
jgi:hypothetical protein